MSTRRAKPNNALASPVLEHAPALVMLWDRAEDWAVPRVPPSQLRVLTVLNSAGPVNLTTLARELGAIPSSASRLCDRLEASGLLTREVSAGSRREVTLSVSTEGRRRLAAFAATRRSDFTQVLELMTPEARAKLIDGLRQFSEAVEVLHQPVVAEA
ncbi:MAG: MarR family winged helix-turn-helix transcriptional regulator [Jatrophihabitans sp.]